MAPREYPRTQHFESVPLDEVRAALRRRQCSVEKVTEKREPYSVRINSEPRRVSNTYVRAPEERRRRG